VLKPVLQALVLADNVYQDKFTGKMIIAGTFNQLFIIKPHEKSVEPQPPHPQAVQPAPPLPSAPPTPPSMQPPQPMQQQPMQPQPPAGGRQMSWQEIRRSGSPYAYVSLTGLHGSAPMELRYTDLANNSPLFSIKFSVKSDDPLKTVETIVPVPSLPAPHAGAYALELFSENEMLGSHRINALDSPPPDARQ
jgi:hypothetical protein